MLNINNDVFIGSQEMNRIQKFFGEDGLNKLIKTLTKSFGIVKNFYDLTFDSFKVIDAVADNKVTVYGDSIAVDKDGKFIVNKDDIDIAIPNDSKYYWLKISHKISNLEDGYVSLASDGALSGSNTKFSEILRGHPEFPTRIALYDQEGINKLAECEVIEVLSDTSSFVALYSGSFPALMRYAVIGTFTPGISIPELSKFIYQYDSCEFELVEEISVDVAPSKSDGEYYICRVINNSGTLTLYDKRNEIWTIDGIWDRGEILSNDFTQATMSLDGNWNSLDFSPIISPNAKAILLRVEFTNTGAASILFKKYGTSSNDLNRSTVFANSNSSDIIVFLDNGRINYKSVGVMSSQSLKITVGGWF